MVGGHGGFEFHGCFELFGHGVVVDVVVAFDGRLDESGLLVVVVVAFGVLVVVGGFFAAPLCIIPVPLSAQCVFIDKLNYWLTLCLLISGY